MIQPQVTLNASGMGSMFRRMSATFKQEYSKILDDAARNTAEELAKHSLPAPGSNPLSGKGNTKEAWDKGQHNVRRDLYSMFVPLESKSVRDLVRQKNMAVFDLANPIDWRDDDLRKAWENRDMETLYNTFSKLTTHVGEADEFEYGEREEDLEELPYIPEPTIKAQQSMMVRGRWDGRSKMLVKNRKVLASFVKQRLLSVGTSVNGWVNIAKRFKSSIIKIMPGAGDGKIAFRNAQGGGEWVMENKYGDPNGMMTEVIQKVAREQQVEMAKKLQDLVRRAVAAAGGRGRP